MKLQVTHRTRYTYASPVRESFNEVRLQPVSNEHQHCDSFLLKVLPAARLSHYTDFHANIIHFFELPTPHATLFVESFAKVTTKSLATHPESSPVPLAALRESGRSERCFDFLQESTYVEKTPEAWRLALDVTAGRDDIWGAACAIMDHIHTRFAYTPNLTCVHTHMRDVLTDNRGVCQDFAHVMIGLCRALHIPALYVSGYLYNGPRDHLLGTQASHAWCEVFVPGIGWCGLDPTNNQPTDERYIKLAIGRDYADVPPVRGHYKGTTDRKMEVEVHIESIE
ncbi:MAG: transglutaminase family protein [Verrucomicrobia bacterium]|nr:transglutaminase family protein [Verrucomicrobiota bacterium]